VREVIERKSEESIVDVVSGEPGLTPPRARIRVIVADDSADWRAVLAALLKVEEYVEVVARVEDGQETIEAVSVLHPDLVILDLGIGSIDALTTTALLCHQFPSLNLILMANRDSPRLRATCQASGAKYFIHKTKFQEEFLPVLVQIRNCLENQKPT